MKESRRRKGCLYALVRDVERGRVRGNTKKNIKKLENVKDQVVARNSTVLEGK